MLLRKPPIDWAAIHGIEDFFHVAGGQKPRRSNNFEHVLKAISMKNVPKQYLWALFHNARQGRAVGLQVYTGKSQRPPEQFFRSFCNESIMLVDVD